MIRISWCKANVLSHSCLLQAKLALDGIFSPISIKKTLDSLNIAFQAEMQNILPIYHDNNHLPKEKKIKFQRVLKDFFS